MSPAMLRTGASSGGQLQPSLCTTARTCVSRSRRHASIGRAGPALLSGLLGIPLLQSRKRYMPRLCQVWWVQRTNIEQHMTMIGASISCAI